MSEENNTLERVIQAIRTCKGTDQAMAADSSLEELGIDSLDVLMLAGELEEEFDLTLDTGNLEGVETVGDIAGRLEDLLC